MPVGCSASIVIGQQNERVQATEINCEKKGGPAYAGSGLRQKSCQVIVLLAFPVYMGVHRTLLTTFVRAFRHFQISLIVDFF